MYTPLHAPVAPTRIHMGQIAFSALTARRTDGKAETTAVGSAPFPMSPLDVLTFVAAGANPNGDATIVVNGAKCTLTWTPIVNREPGIRFAGTPQVVRVNTEDLLPVLQDLIVRATGNPSSGWDTDKVLSAQLQVGTTKTMKDTNVVVRTSTCTEGGDIIGTAFKQLEIAVCKSKRDATPVLLLINISPMAPSVLQAMVAHLMPTPAHATTGTNVAALISAFEDLPRSGTTSATPRRSSNSKARPSRAVASTAGTLWLTTHARMGLHVRVLGTRENMVIRIPLDDASNDRGIDLTEVPYILRMMSATTGTLRFCVPGEAVRFLLNSPDLPADLRAEIERLPKTRVVSSLDRNSGMLTSNAVADIPSGRLARLTLTEGAMTDDDTTTASAGSGPAPEPVSEPAVIPGGISIKGEIFDALELSVHVTKEIRPTDLSLAMATMLLYTITGTATLTVT